MPTVLPRGVTACPYCGLALVVCQQDDHQTIHYDFREWAKLCKWPELESPVLCLIAGPTKSD